LTEAQLKLWGIKIEEIAAKNRVPGVRVGFDALLYVDELKALHAIAQSKLEDFRAAGDQEGAHLIKAEMKRACDELDAALKGVRPRRKRMKLESEADR